MKILSFSNIINRFKKKTLIYTTPSFQTIASDDCKVHSDIPVRFGKKRASLSTVCTNSYERTCSHHISTQVRNRKGNMLGHYDYSINTNNKTIACGCILTKSKYRHRGIGEIMRLSSLMELLENNIRAIKITALPKAILFHFKYKFLPDFKWKSMTLSILNAISENKHIEKSDAEQAQKFIDRINEEYDKETFELKPQHAQKVNDFVAKYIEKYKTMWDKANFNKNLPMILTAQRVNECSEFFNPLFKKHGIDYTI